MDVVTQRVLDELARMELRLTDVLAGRGGKQAPASSSFATPFDSFKASTTSSTAAPRYDDDVIGSSAGAAYDDAFATSARERTSSSFGDDRIEELDVWDEDAVGQPRLEFLPFRFLASVESPCRIAAAAFGSADELADRELRFDELSFNDESTPHHPAPTHEVLFSDGADPFFSEELDILPTSEFDEGPIFDEEPCFHRSLLNSDPDSLYDWVERIITLSPDCTATNSFRVGSCDDNHVGVKQSSVDTQSLRTASSAGEFEAPYRDRREQPRRNEALDVVCELYRNRHEQTHVYEAPDAPSFSSGIDDDIDVVEELHIPARGHQRDAASANAADFASTVGDATPQATETRLNAGWVRWLEGRTGPYDDIAAAQTLFSDFSDDDSARTCDVTDVPVVHSALKVFDQMSSRGSDASPGFRDLVFLAASASSSCSVEDERPKVPSSIGNNMHLVSRFLSSRLDGGVKKPLQEYLLALKYQSTKLLISNTLDTMVKLQAALLLAQGCISEQNPDTPYQQTNSQLLEFTWGLANSGYPFDIRPDLVKGDSAVLPPEFASAVEGRALLTMWWPQEAALQHEKPDEQQQPELIQKKELKQCYLSLEKGFNSMTVSQPGTLFHEAMKVRKRLGAIVDHLSQDRRQRPRERDLLLLAFILDSRETLTDAQISDNVIDARFAVREATASVLTWMFMFLDDHAAFLKAVTEGVKAFEPDLIAKANSFVHGGCVSELYHLAPIVCASVNGKTCMRACTTTSMADELVVSEEVDEVLNALSNRQPWPPPRQFAIIADGVQVRPLPWPSFYCHAGGDYHGDVCITPSVHGTNPASDAMVGMKMVAIGTDDKGYIHIEELRKAAEANKDTLAGDSPFSDATPAPTRLRRW